MSGAVVWIEGLPGSGKTTTAHLLKEELLKRGISCRVVDGDALRAYFTGYLGFSAEGRRANARIAAHLASIYAEKGDIVVVALITPYEASRQEVRRIVGPVRFLEVYLKCPIELCKSRDPKGVYAGHHADSSRVTGVDDPFEEPKSAELTVDTAITPPDKVVMAIDVVLTKTASASPRTAKPPEIC